MKLTIVGKIIRKIRKAFPIMGQIHHIAERRIRGQEQV